MSARELSFTDGGDIPQPTAVRKPDLPALLAEYRRDATALRQKIESQSRRSRNADIRALFAALFR